MKETTQNKKIDEITIAEILTFLFSISLLPILPSVSEVRQFVCSRLNLSYEEFSKVERVLLKRRFVLRYAGRKLLLTPKGVLYAIWVSCHERK